MVSHPRKGEIGFSYLQIEIGNLDSAGAFTLHRQLCLFVRAAHQSGQSTGGTDLVSEETSGRFVVRIEPFESNRTIVAPFGLRAAFSRSSREISVAQRLGCGRQLQGCGSTASQSGSSVGGVPAAQPASVRLGDCPSTSVEEESEKLWQRFRVCSYSACSLRPPVRSGEIVFRRFSLGAKKCLESVLVLP
jgi:hypothetical protein